MEVSRRQFMIGGAAAITAAALPAVAAPAPAFERAALWGDSYLDVLMARQYQRAITALMRDLLEFNVAVYRHGTQEHPMLERIDPREIRADGELPEGVKAIRGVPTTYRNGEKFYEFAIKGDGPCLTKDQFSASISMGSCTLTPRRGATPGQSRTDQYQALSSSCAPRPMPSASTSIRADRTSSWALKPWRPGLSSRCRR